MLHFTRVEQQRLMAVPKANSTSAEGPLHSHRMCPAVFLRAFSCSSCPLNIILLYVIL